MKDRERDRERERERERGGEEGLATPFRVLKAIRLRDDIDSCRGVSNVSAVIRECVMVEHTALRDRQ